MQTLDEYWAKRDFKKTSEPSGKGKHRASKGPGGLFVVQKHAATRLHYDLRLEHDGVLWSWAVARGPSLDPAERRLAVRTEDHPLDYAGFEGVIPKGQYGAGAVIIWDEGVWVPAAGYDPAAMMARGDMKFDIKGSKLNGGWHLIRLKPKPGEKAENWLLFKNRDAWARPEGDILEEAPQSVRSGLTIEDVKAGRDASLSAQPAGPAVKSKAASPKGQLMPGFIEPCLATLSPAPSGDDWLHEIKFDGYRVQARLDKDKCQLFTRSGLDWTPKFGGEIVKAIVALPCRNAILDGEITVLDADGRSSFSLLQQALSAGDGAAMVYYLFDLLYLDGRDLRDEPLASRKEQLRKLLAQTDGPLKFSEHFTEPGPTIFKHVCKIGLEGIVSKRADAPYRSGRVQDWLKAKCVLRQEFVVVGYLPSEKTGRGLRSLILAFHEAGKLVPAGNVGTGFNARSIASVLSKLQALRPAQKPPIDGPLGRQKGAIWVEPKLVAEVEYRDRTIDRILRHASFVGLREDKAAQDVVDETASSEPGAPPGTVPDGKRSAKAGGKAMATTVTLSSPDKQLWPKAGVTKKDLLAHYELVWRRMERFVVNRPLSLVRAPDGVDGQRFFQKHASPGMSAAIRRLKDPEDGEELLYIDSFDGLAALVQYGVVEIHVWGSAIDDIERPDQIIFDLDPDESVTPETVRNATLEVSGRLTGIGLPAFVKVTGGKGFHVVVPLKPAADWTVVKTFAHDFANAMEHSAPDRYTANLSKKARVGRIFIDYLRNGRGATAIAPWSTRAKDAATVSVPVAWSELDEQISPDAFTVGSAQTQTAVKAADPWAGFDGVRKALKT